MIPATFDLKPEKKSSDHPLSSSVSVYVSPSQISDFCSFEMVAGENFGIGSTRAVSRTSFYHITDATLTHKRQAWAPDSGGCFETVSIKCNIISIEVALAEQPQDAKVQVNWPNLTNNNPLVSFFACNDIKQVTHEWRSLIEVNAISEAALMSKLWGFHREVNVFYMSTVTHSLCVCYR